MGADLPEGCRTCASRLARYAVPLPGFFTQPLPKSKNSRLGNGVPLPSSSTIDVPGRIRTARHLRGRVPGRAQSDAGSRAPTGVVRKISAQAVRSHHATIPITSQKITDAGVPFTKKVFTADSR